MDYAREERSGKPGRYSEREKKRIYNKKSMIDNIIGNTLMNRIKPTLGVKQ